MKRILPVVFLLIALSLTAAQLDLTGNMNEPVFASSETNEAYTEFTFNLASCRLEQIDVNGVDYQRVAHSQAAYSVEEGYPETPIFSTLIGLPDQGGVEIELVDPQYATLSGLNYYPSQGVNLEGETRGFVRNEAFYSGQSDWSQQDVVIGEPALMRGVRVASVNVNPVSYDPQTGEARVLQSATIRVHNTRQIGGNSPMRNMPRSRSFEKLFAATILNWDDIRDIDEPFQARTILLIRPVNTQLDDMVDQFVDWKLNKGFDVTVATTSETGTTNSSIKDYIEDAYTTWENPPEFIILLGDVGGSFAIPSWIENYSYYNGTGDYPYTLLDGDDYLPDAFIGRISIESTNDFLTFLTKMNIYERDVYMDDLSLYHQSLLVGDTQPSGLSCVITNKYVKEQILMKDPTHTFTELYAPDPSPTQMNAALNDGCLFFNYRGWIGMSGWGQSNISALTNTDRLTNATILTCDTGSFNGTSRTELLFRAGTPSDPRGSVSSIGMATSGTHTQFNNILQGGMYQGIQSEGMRTMGEALARAEVSMWLAYGECATNYAYMFIHWCNQIGDPSMDIWVSEPIVMSATYNSEIPAGRGWLDVNVEDADGEALENAWVTARSDNIFASGYTDASGQITLRFDAPSEGDEVSLIITKPDYKPVLGGFDVIAAMDLGFSSMTIDDDNNGESQGNDNGEANPGELIELIVGIQNSTSSAINGVSATLSTGSPYLNIIDNEEDYGTIAAGNVGLCLEDYDIEIMPDAPDRLEALMILEITDDSNETWVDRVWIEIYGSDLDIISYETVDGNNGVLDAGETAPFRLTVKNNGAVPLTGVYADLYSLNGLVSEIDTMAYFGDIAVGQTVTCSADPFEIEGLNQIIPGMTVDLQITFFNEDGYEETEILKMELGEVTVDDAAGPDAYGYICFDDGDTGYLDAPDYEWIEIETIGEDTGLSDTGDEGDEICRIDLPFTFKFYGEEYSAITISTNGWVSFYDTEQLTFRNWPIPDGLGPNSQIAVFWDDLRTNNGGIYYHYDDTTYPTTPCFIIEWVCKNAVSSANEKFQLILFDPTYIAAPTGDGVFKMQYADFNNVDGTNHNSGAQGNYCTIGIESPNAEAGLQYTYNNEYPTGARQITDGTALFFTTTPVVYPDSWLTLGDVIVHDENGSGFIDAGETVELGIWLENIGMSASGGAFATFECSDSYATVVSDTSGYRYIDAGSKGVNRSYFELQVSPNAPDNREMACNISINNADGQWSYPFFLTVHKPTLEVYSVLVSDQQGDNNGVLDPGETCQLIVNMRNVSLTPAMGIETTLTTSSDDISIDVAEMTYGDLQPGESVQKVFTVDVASDAEIPSSAWFALETDAELLDTQTFDFPVGIGDWGFSYDFENDNGGLSAYGGWQYGEPSVGAHSGTHAWATHLNTNYGNGAEWFLGTSAFFIGENTTLSFWHYYDTELNYDGGNVKVSTSNGISWEVVEPIGGYPTASVHNNNPAIGGEPAFTGESGGWVFVEFDLSEFANHNIKLRWHFASDSGVVDYGWAIDDVIVSGGAERSGIINGTVSLDEDNDPLECVWVKAGDYAAHPDETGEYTLYTRAGTFDLTGELRWYEPGVVSDLLVEQGAVIDDEDLELLWLPDIDSLDYVYNQDTGQVTISWDATEQLTRKQDVRRRNSAYNTRYDFEQVNIWTRQETGPATMIDSVLTGLEWSTVIDTTREYMFWVEQQYDTGVSAPSDTVMINIEIVSNGEEPVPGFSTTLLPNYPNPFNPTTTIAFSLAEPGYATLKIYNVRGQLVRTLAQGNFEAGDHQIVWNGKDANRNSCGSGVYFYRLEAAGYTRVRKALLLK